MASSEQASIRLLQLCVGYRKPMRVVESVEVITGLGIEGDRHSSDRGNKAKRQVLLMDEETLEAFGLSHGEVMENVTTSGIDLASLKEGQKLGLGDQVVLEITGPCEPCGRMDEIRQGLRQELDGRRGMLAYVAEGGHIRVGDPIRLIEGTASR